MYSEASLGLSSVPTVSAAFEYNDKASSGDLDSKIFAAFSKSWAADSGLPPGKIFGFQLTSMFN